MLIDAKFFPADVCPPPIDFLLLNEDRELNTTLIDVMHQLVTSAFGHKPCIYCKHARYDFLAAAMNKRPRINKARMPTRHQLGHI